MGAYFNKVMPRETKYVKTLGQMTLCLYFLTLPYYSTTQITNGLVHKEHAHTNTKKSLMTKSTVWRLVKPTV